MSRDHRKLRVFGTADALVEAIYRVTSGFPASERFGLQAQLRRASVSVPSNIVEGSARRTTREYGSFLNIAAGSAAETRYLIELAVRLGFVAEADARPILIGYSEVLAQLVALMRGINNLPEALSLKP